MTINEAQQLVEVWNAKNGVRHGGFAGVALLTEKVGELARAAAQSQADHHSAASAAAMQRELAEVFWELLSMAAHSGGQLSEALIDLLEEKNS